MKSGAIIIVSGNTNCIKKSEPLKKIGTISIIQRIILTFKQADIDHIVLVYSKQSMHLERQVSKLGVVFLLNENEDAQRIDNVKVGLRYLYEKCEKILVTPVDIPLFNVATITKLLDSQADLANPICNGKSGHPLLLSFKLVPHILNYEGRNGLNGAIKSSSYDCKLIEVDDEGILLDIEKDEDYDGLLAKHNLQYLRPDMRLRIAREEPFFGPGIAHLLELIQNTESVRMACQQIGISYSKGWKMIDLMEKQLGYMVVARQQGGKNGGKAILTSDGSVFLEKYLVYEKECRDAVEQIFHKHFS